MHPKRYPVGAKTSPNAENLEALGAERLAELLMELGAGDTAVKRRLRMELAGAGRPGELAKEIRNRLISIGRSRSFIDTRGVRAIAGDLETHRRAIAEEVAKSDPTEALELLWRLMALARPIFERSDDGSGRIIDVFHVVCENIGPTAVLAKVDPIGFADRVYDALVLNDYGQYDGLIGIAAPALGPSGLAHLKRRMIELSNQPVKRPADKDRRAVGWASRGPIYEDEIAERSRQSAVRQALKDIADAQGDVDAFIDQYDESTRRVPKIAAEIGRRLLAAGRPEEALTVIDAAEHRNSGRWDWPDFEWEDARIDALEALGRTDDSQKVRWACFERSLSATHLREYLKRLPDFDDVAAEAKALDCAESFRNLTQALFFLVAWPALDRAANLVIRRAAELDGDRYEILPRVADALSAKHPLAATLALRALIDFSLTRSRSSRYKHAARHLLACAGLAKGMKDFGAVETHDAYEARLRREHRKKTSFWSLVS